MSENIAADFTEYDVEADPIALERILQDYKQRSDAALGQPHIKWHKDLAYAAHEDARLDIAFAAQPSNKVAMFFHGGWWRSGSKETRAFLAPHIIAQNMHFVNVEYPLAPQAGLPEIVHCARQALAYAYKYFEAELAAQPEFTIIGNSAGGHLATTICTTEHLAHIGLPQHAIKELIAVSGLYDLTPLKHLPPNEWLKLDDDVIHQYSPALLNFPPHLKVLLAIGDAEPIGFFRQADLFELVLQKQNMTCVKQIRAGLDHMEIIAEIPKLIPFAR